MADLTKSYYFGQDITCYPSSNATDDGKLNLEFNMARLVTRVSSKNFCILKPSYELNLITDSSTGYQYISVGTGQCSINGMDLIMTSEITIDPPVDPGHYYLAFKLERDGSNNVKGDTVTGVTTVFEGVGLGYYTEKPDPQTDMDMLYLGSFDWDGSEITNLEEDEDKYGRLWAEDVMGKFEDPKHPDIRRMNLQELIYKLPDWYFSKEGDTVYGPIILADHRLNNNPGIILNVDENGSHITIKDPTVDNEKLLRYGDVNRDGSVTQADIDLIQSYINGEISFSTTQTALADVNHDGVVDEKDIQYIKNFLNQEGNPGDTNNIYYITATDKGINFDVEGGESRWEIGKAEIYEKESDDILHIHNIGQIDIDAEGSLNLQADDKVTMSTEADDSIKLTLDDDTFTLTDPDAPDLKYDISFPNVNIINNTFGKAIWQYDQTTERVKLLQNNVRYLDIVPNGLFENRLTVQDTIYVGPLDDVRTFLQQRKWQMTSTDNNKQVVLLPNGLTMTNKTLSASDNSYILLTNNGNSNSNKIYTQIYDDAKIELVNPSRNATILWKDGNTAYDVTLEKIRNEKRLNLQGDFTITSNLTAGGLITGNGLTTTNGVLTFKRGTNDATITKDNNSNNLRTSNDLYVGGTNSNGVRQGSMYTGNVIVNQKLAVGGDTIANAEFTVDEQGNLETSGTIRGSKVYNAVYNDYAEVFEKEETEVIEPGDVVCIREDGLTHKVQTVEDINTIIGVCSNTEGVLLGGKDLPEERKVIVGMVGKLYAKTNNPYLRPGQLVKVLPDGTVDFTNNKTEKFGITMSNVEDGKVKIVYNG